MIDKYQEDISYPFYIRNRPNGISIADTMINKLISMGGINLTYKCLSYRSECGINVLYCLVCFELLTKKLKDSLSFCN